MCAYTYTYAYVVRTHMRIHIYIYIFIYTHTCIPINDYGDHDARCFDREVVMIAATSKAFRLKFITFTKGECLFLVYV